MADLYPVAGCRAYIGGVHALQNADFVAADFAAEVWVEIDGFETMGSLSDATNMITTALINRNRDIAQKGTASNPDIAWNFAQIATDAGQIALLAAGQPSNKSNYAFRVDLNDQVGGGQPSKRYFVGLVTTAEPGGGANTVRMLNATIHRNSNTVNVAAT